MDLLGLLEFLGLFDMGSYWVLILLIGLAVDVLLTIHYKEHTVWVIREKYLVESKSQKFRRGIVIVVFLVLAILPIFFMRGWIDTYGRK